MAHLRADGEFLEKRAFCQQTLIHQCGNDLSCSLRTFARLQGNAWWLGLIPRPTGARSFPNRRLLYHAFEAQHPDSTAPCIFKPPRASTGFLFGLRHSRKRSEGSSLQRAGGPAKEKLLRWAVNSGMVPEQGGGRCVTLEPAFTGLLFV